MSDTPRKHFEEDIARAFAMLELAKVFEDSQKGRPERKDPTVVRLYNDIRISAIATAAGSMDAYLCDAYVDCLSSVLIAYARGKWRGKLPRAYSTELLPAGEVLTSSRSRRPAWNVRMAVRKVMERDNMLIISKVPQSFNGILPSSNKLWGDLLPALMMHRRKRLTGPKSYSEISKMEPKQKKAAINHALYVFKSRISGIVQIRHNWIHNCARPRLVIVTYTHAQAEARISDIAVFVKGFDDHLRKYRLI